MRSSRLLATFLPFCAVLTLISAVRAAEESHFPTSEDLRHVKALGGPQLSPDGKLVLFSITDATADGAKAHLWVVSSAGASDTLRQLTFSPPSDKRGERNPQWAPDSAAIFFLAKRGEQTQLFRLDMRGGEAAPYDLKVQPVVDESKEKNAIPPPGAEKKETEKKESDKKEIDKKADEKAGDKDKKIDEPLPIDVSGYSLAADGKWLAVWAKDPQTPGEKKQKDAKADAEWVNHDVHGTRLYLVALKADGSLEGALRATNVETDVHAALWSPAGDRVLVITEKPNEQSDLGPANSAWVLDAPSPQTVRKVDGIPATVGGAAWSPDSARVVFAAATPEDAPPGYDELFAISMADGGSAPVRLAAGFTGMDR